MASVFYLCRVEHHVQRIHDKQGGRRIRCRFPSHRWFVQLVKEHGLSETLRSNDGSVSARFSLVGVMRCTAGISPDDLLSPYRARDELSVWKGFWQAMGNVYTILMDGCLVFTEPMDIHTYLDRRFAEPRAVSGRRHALSPFVPSLPDMLSAAPGHLWRGKENLGPQKLQDVFQAWGRELSSSTLAAPVVEPIAWLMLQGKWSSIGLLGHWNLRQNLFDVEYPPDSLKGLLFREEDEDLCVALSRDRVSSLLERVRGWAPLLLDCLEDEEQAGVMKLELADTLRWFETLKLNLQGLGVKRAYESHILRTAVFFAFVLGSHKNMAEAIPLALKLALPGIDLDELVKRIQVPRATTLARASTYLDFAYILYCRERWQKTPHRLYTWADSSPQSGRDWYMMMHAGVPVDCLIDTMTAANALTRSREDLCDEGEACELDLEDLTRFNEALKVNLTHHVCVPLTMGSARTKVENKVACLLHALALECPNRDVLSNHLGSVVSWTADLGTDTASPVSAFGFERTHPSMDACASAFLQRFARR